MGKSPYFRYLILQILTIPAVMGIFRMIPDRKVASLFASAVFLGLSLGLSYWEYRRQGWQALGFWVTGSIFFILFAVPIFLLRVTHWEMDFSEITVGPLQANFLHRYSNLSFILWMIATAFYGWKQRAK